MALTAFLKLGEGAALLPGFASDRQQALFANLEVIAAAAPFRTMVTPGGHSMSVAMTNCGVVGWVTDRRGYRYTPDDPETGKAWPPMAPLFATLAAQAATAGGFTDFQPDCCLINRYAPKARMSLHQDRDEADASQPIVSVSLGVAGTFLWGGLARADRPRRIVVHGGDVVVWGGPARFVYHGVAPLAESWHDLTGSFRFNLTFRKAR